MSASIPVTPKKRGRPSEGGRDPIVPVRMPVELRDALDGWISNEPEPKPTRSEAIRVALRDWLTDFGYLPQPDAPESAN